MNTMIRFSPLHLINRWHGDFDRFFDAVDSEAATQSWAPAVDIEDQGDSYLLRADLPGIEAKDIELELLEGVLSLKGTRKFESKTEDGRYAWSERRAGSFERRFKLPEATGGDVSAKLANGVLEVSIPKPAKLQPRRIEVVS